MERSGWEVASMRRSWCEGKEWRKEVECCLCSLVVLLEAREEDGCWMSCLLLGEEPGLINCWTSLQTAQPLLRPQTFLWCHFGNSHSVKNLHLSVCCKLESVWHFGDTWKFGWVRGQYKRNAWYRVCSKLWCVFDINTKFFITVVMSFKTWFFVALVNFALKLPRAMSFSRSMQRKARFWSLIVGIFVVRFLVRFLVQVSVTLCLEEKSCRSGR